MGNEINGKSLGAAGAANGGAKAQIGKPGSFLSRHGFKSIDEMIEFATQRMPSPKDSDLKSFREAFLDDPTIRSKVLNHINMLLRSKDKKNLKMRKTLLKCRKLILARQHEEETLAAKAIRKARRSANGGAKLVGRKAEEEGVEGLGKAWRAVRKFGQEVFEFVIKRAH